MLKLDFNIDQNQVKFVCKAKKCTFWVKYSKTEEKKSVEVDLETGREIECPDPVYNKA